MSSTVKFYTAGGNLERMTIHSVTSEEDGYPKERLLDQNLDTAWRPTEESAGNMVAQDIIIDAGIIIAVNSYALWVQNYKRDFSTSAEPTPEFELYYSSVGTGGPWDSAGGTHAVNDWNTPIRLKEISLNTKRYWKISIPALDEAIHLSGLWLCRLFELEQGATYPDESTIQYFNSYRVTPGGRIYTRAINSNPIRILPRTYNVSTITKQALIQNMFLHNLGRRYPLFLQEGTLQGTVRFVYLMADRLQQAKIDYNLWTITLPFQEVPYIDDGDTH